MLVDITANFGLEETPSLAWWCHYKWPELVHPLFSIWSKPEPTSVRLNCYSNGIIFSFPSNEWGVGTLVYNDLSWSPFPLFFMKVEFENKCSQPLGVLRYSDHTTSDWAAKYCGIQGRGGQCTLWWSCVLWEFFDKSYHI